MFRKDLIKDMKLFFKKVELKELVRVIGYELDNMNLWLFVFYNSLMDIIDIWKNVNNEYVSYGKIKFRYVDNSNIVYSYYRCKEIDINKYEDVIDNIVLDYKLFVDYVVRDIKEYKEMEKDI